ncbi:MAG: hypothetical protein A2000_13385 [Ignavibacteria bacterium GWB2_36_8]|nr:MAG: hypothetical protein A2000_13385 [Ignavibacteria bacterium GWB2_36_8]
MVNNGKTMDSTAIDSSTIYFRAQAYYGTSLASFSYSFDDNSFILFGNKLSMRFNLSIFTGNKFCLFNYATVATGGFVDFDWFRISMSATTEVSPEEGILNEIPRTFFLGQNFPNPFNPSTQIKYSVPQSGYITLKAYNLLSEEVATLYQGILQPGNYEATFDGTKLASGVYLYQLSARNFIETKKLILLK